MIKLSVPSEDQKVLGTQKNCKRMHFMLYEEGATASHKVSGRGPQEVAIENTDHQ